MAWSKCAKCDGTYFEVVEKEPANSAYKVMFVQCRGCGAPIGTLDYYNAGSLLKKQEGMIAALDNKIDRLAHTVDQIAHVLRK